MKNGLTYLYHCDLHIHIIIFSIFLSKNKALVCTLHITILYCIIKWINNCSIISIVYLFNKH